MILKAFFSIFFLSCVQFFWAQFSLDIHAKLDDKTHTINVSQKINWTNNQNKTMTKLVLNDWNQAFSNVETELAKRFSNEFRFNFHFSKALDKGFTQINQLLDENNQSLAWQRLPEKEDLVEIILAKPLLPNETMSLTLNYKIKLPNDKYTRYGFSKNGEYALKNWLLAPAFIQNGEFVYEPQLNMDDNVNSFFDAKFVFEFSKELKLTTNLKINDKIIVDNRQIITSKEQNINDIYLYLEKKNSFNKYHDVNGNIIETADQYKKINPIQKAILVNQVSKFADSILGIDSKKNVLVSGQDFQKNPFVGLNQVPNFISPFSDDFMFEINLIKNYSDNYLKTHLKINQRQDYWMIDAIQMYILMKYVDTYYPDEKMLGKVSRFFLIRGYKISRTTFNEQLSYFYLLMARRNLDQALHSSRDELIKFNQQLANKYRSGLALKYLAAYIGNENVEKGIALFIDEAQKNQSDSNTFIKHLKSQTTKDINWFYDEVINGRKIIDYRLTESKKENNSTSFKMTNLGEVAVPMPLTFYKNKEAIKQIWVYSQAKDTIISIDNLDYDKVVLNEKNLVPEFNLKNNYLSTKKGLFANRKLKINLIKDIEDPQYNQLMVNPQFSYNLYNGILLGAAFDNNTILERPFTFEIQPEYGTTSKDLNGALGLEYNDFRRNSNWFRKRYAISASMRNYTFDAKFIRFSPSYTAIWRPDNFRENHSRVFSTRLLVLHREDSNFEVLESENSAYTVLNVRYADSKTELTSRKHWRYDLQLASKFGKLNAEFEFRHMFTDQRLLSFRVFAGAFLYNKTTTDFFSYGISRPTNYLFDYNLLATSETSGFLSQQFILAEGGFKSFMNQNFVNRWLVTSNFSYAIWRWFEVYGDVGLYETSTQKPTFIYDSGLRVNLVPDYFEVYFPLYANNRWEVDNNYSEKIRFVVTLNLNRLTSLFTRRWF